MPKDHCTACACLIFLGPCGGHRCYLDDICCGILYFLTFGFAYIGVLCDCCYLGTMVQAANLKYAGGGGNVAVVVQNNITNSNSQPQQVYQPPMQPYQQPYQQQPQPQFMTQPYNPPPPADWQQGRAKGGFCSSCGASKEGRFCGQCGRE
jgi:TM2 domain-containing membrane protein YozV